MSYTESGAQMADSYSFDETSVLPELPEDLDTIVQPELSVSYKVVSEPGPVAPSPASEPAASVDAIPAAAVAEPVRLQPTVTSGPLVSDVPETMVLMSEANSASPVVEQVVAGQRTIQLTRENGDTCVLTAFPVTIGKGPDADLLIEDNGAISRLHVRVLRDGDVFAAEDLGSTNKTFIGSYELLPHTPTILSDGDVLRLANEALQVRVV